jgi:hypothetical protein
VREVLVSSFSDFFQLIPVIGSRELEGKVASQSRNWNWRRQNTSCGWVGNTQVKEMGLYAREFSLIVAIPVHPPWLLLPPVVDLEVLERLQIPREGIYFQYRGKSGRGGREEGTEERRLFLQD